MANTLRIIVLCLALLTAGCGVIFPDTEFEWNIVWWIVGGVVILSVGIAVFSVVFGDSDEDEK